MKSAKTARLCRVDQSVLVVIDIQNRLTAAMPVKVLARIQRNVETLIKAATLLQIPVIATEQYPKGLGSMSNSFQRAPTATKKQHSLARAPLVSYMILNYSSGNKLFSRGWKRMFVCCKPPWI